MSPFAESVIVLRWGGRPESRSNVNPSRSSAPTAIVTSPAGSLYINQALRSIKITLDGAKA